jgi:TetR/AcrR family transcriptional regulator, transcriptional repressor for nem operon
MRTTREQASATRERIIETAGRLFREKGFDGIGVADLMKGAGLTHGGFYSHFDSKEDLMAAACTRALKQSLASWHAQVEKQPGRALETIARSYLSPRHRDRPDGATACIVAADGADIARLGDPVRKATSRGIEKQLELLETLVAGRTRAARRKRAITTYASLLGGLLLARILDDPALSSEVLESVTDSIGKP